MEPTSQLTSKSYNKEKNTLLAAVKARIPSRLRLANKLSKHSNAVVHNATVGNVMNGMRGIPGVLWDVSETGPHGVTYHGKTLQQLLKELPKWKASQQLSPEAMLWFLYTATIPTISELEDFTSDLVRRAQLPDDVISFCDSLSPDLPANAQVISCLAVLSRHSKFSAALANGVAKADLWESAFEDALDGSARFSILIARIYSNKYTGRRGQKMALDLRSDLASNCAAQMGRGGDKDFIELTRLYWALHMDHGVNVSAHAMRLSSSAWTDVYLSFCGGLIALTGALHGGAIPNAVKFNLTMADRLGPEPSQDAIEGYLRRRINQGQIIPGYGHAVLRGRDPRFEIIMGFINDHPLPDGVGSETGKSGLDMVRRAQSIVPGVLRSQVPHIKHPAPNVDALSGCVLHAFGIPVEFLLPFMSCSRMMGITAQLVWDRVLRLPIERPLSVTMEELAAKL